MEFSPSNPVVKRCLQGMVALDAGHAEAATEHFIRAWHDATNDLERFLAAWYLARQQPLMAERLHWFETALQHAIRLDDDTARSALPALHGSISECFTAMGDDAQAKAHEALAASFEGTPSDRGPFYHGTRADLKTGDFLNAGGSSNYQANLTMNHIYFTALINGAGLAAALAAGEARERVYIVEPTGSFENDPNVTNKKFPGNPTRSYRSVAPLRIVGEATDWARVSAEELLAWRQKLASGKGEIIN